MSLPSKEHLGLLLVKKKLITEKELQEALKIQRDKPGKIGEILIGLGCLSKETLLEVLSGQLGIPVIRLGGCRITAEVIRKIPRKMAEHYCLIPVAQCSNTLTVAMADPVNITAIDDIRRTTGMAVCPTLAMDTDIKEAIGVYYDENVTEALKDAMKDMTLEDKLEVEETAAGAGREGTARELLRLTEEEPVVRLTNSVLMEGVKRRSSDIFIEPEEKTLRVRFRVDGLLQEGLVTAHGMHAGVVSRIKVISNLDIAEHRVPQDGRFKIQIRGQEIDFRVSVLPTYFGEKVVLRILDKSQAMLDIERLGFEPSPLEALKKASGHPHGMMVVCGPTGAGKTTTLYSVLKFVDSPEKNIVTVEDPVEYQIEGINQVAIRPEVNLTFAAALRSILRQDPDIIMVGEIRDAETADIAIKAALTGHLVLSTLHATTAVGAVTRLLNMGIEPFLITSSVLLTGSQRLVRKVCAKCRESYEPSKEFLRQLGVSESDLKSKKPVFFRGRGCPACAQKGYSGRAVLLEAMTMTPAVKTLILKGAQEHEIKRLAVSEGMMTLRENGIAKILQGTTTAEEVLRVTVRDGEAAE
ncbi:MAG: Flp pilus assembly complex ATPase component TadA [Candidatus Omnitrophica bacterium]|nr:Flp pilus assembly complex ATPase component TadA [Candidatus Omnitrophota bacterium]